VGVTGLDHLENKGQTMDMDQDVLKGRNTVFLIAGIIIIIEIMLAIFMIILGKPITLSQIIRWLATLLLYYLIFRGYRWSKIIMAVLSSISFFVMSIMTFFVLPIWSFPSQNIILVLYWTFTLFVTIAMGVSAGVLALSKKIIVFQEYQRIKSDHKPNE
jgi:hypothetical protein